MNEWKEKLKGRVARGRIEIECEFHGAVVRSMRAGARILLYKTVSCKFEMSAMMGNRVMVLKHIYIVLAVYPDTRGLPPTLLLLYSTISNTCWLYYPTFRSLLLLLLFSFSFFFFLFSFGSEIETTKAWQLSYSKGFTPDVLWSEHHEA